MNSKVSSILILAILAIGILAWYTFGPFSHPMGIHLNPSSVVPLGRVQDKINPVSPNGGGSPTGSSSILLPPQIDLIQYENRDLTENYYKISFPSSWQIQAGKPDGYSLLSATGKGSVTLMDVPDNSTLELYVLSHEEPDLQKILQGYHRLSYEKKTIAQQDAFHLIYTYTVGSVQYHGERFYIAGPDKALLLSCTEPSIGGDMSALLPSVLQSFSWLTY